MHEKDDKLIFEGLTVCWHCGKVVKGKMVLRGEEELSYLIYECPEDGVYEHLMGKGRLSYLGLISQEIPAHWPLWEARLGTFWDDGSVKNRENLPVLVFGATTMCNSSCKICSFAELRNSSPYYLDTEFIKNKLSFYKGKEVILCGGEVTLREDLPELIRIIRKSGNNPVIQTNGLKLAQREYVKQLKATGLEHVHLSFDGFREEIYERVRGGKHEYGLKLAALDNLIKEGIRISLTTVVIKDVNEDQIPEVINYASKVREVIEIAFLCFCLTPTGMKNGFTPGNILSSEEIRKIVAESLSVPEEDFLLWDEFKMNLAFYLDRLKSTFPFVPLPVFRNGMIYFKRGKNGISPLLTQEQLRRLTGALKKNKVKDLFAILGPKILKMMFRNNLPLRRSEDLFYHRGDMFKVSIISPLNTYCFSPTSLTSFGFYDPHIGMYNKLHQR